MNINAKDTWNSIIKSLNQPHVLQTTEWGQIKSAVGWKPHYASWNNPDGSLFAAAMILKRSVPIPLFSSRLAILYTPKGPLLDDWSDEPNLDSVLNGLQKFARNHQSIFLKIDPDIPLAYGEPDSEVETDEIGTRIVPVLEERGWLPSNEQIQFRNTIHIDISKDEDTILKRMKQKTRYNIRLAGRKGVSVRLGTQDELPLLYQMYAATSIRNGFVIRNMEYYLRTWQTFLQAGKLDILIAEVENQPVAGITLFHFGQTAWYMHGMSTTDHREKMAPYLLQWEAIRLAKSRGCTRYDLWGAPDVFDERDPMWGVYKFKRGLGGEVVRTIGAWDFPVNPFLYKMYTQVIPRILSIMRSRGKSRTKSTIEPFS